MTVKKYSKLVRDKIPQIITAQGNIPVTKTLSHEEYIVMLNKKLEEELCEYQKDNDIEELADLLEVIFAVANAKGISVEELEQIRQRKAEARGSFKKKILLEEVIEEN